MTRGTSFTSRTPYLPEPVTPETAEQRAIIRAAFEAVSDPPSVVRDLALRVRKSGSPLTSLQSYNCATQKPVKPKFLGWGGSTCTRRS